MVCRGLVGMIQRKVIIKDKKKKSALEDRIKGHIPKRGKRLLEHLEVVALLM